MLKAVINNSDQEFDELADLHRALNDGHCEEYREIWVQDGASSMCALAAGEIAWLMMTCIEDVSSFSSRNLKCSKPDDEMMTFQLANGQVDEYPVAWTLPSSQWVPAILLFAETGELTENIDWHEDT